MIDIKFYNHSKRENSTLRPTGEGATFQCNLKQSTNLLTPIIELRLDNYPTWNYCYIPSFNKYYFINDITYDRGLYLIHLTIDYLATGKDYIGNQDFYILRSSVEYDGNIIDTYQQPKINTTFINKSVLTSKTIHADFKEGCYIIGVQSAVEACGSTTTYYLLDNDSFTKLKSFLYDNFETYTADLGLDMGEGIVKALFDPLQYITSVYWFPINFKETEPNMGQLVTSLKMGWFSLGPGYGFNAKLLGTNADLRPFIALNRYYVEIPKHPQIARGNYLNGAPYSNYLLRLFPFGDIRLNGNDLAPYNYLVGYTTIDLITGRALLKLAVSNDGETNLGDIGSYSADYGVLIPLTKEGVDSVSLITGGVGTALGAMQLASGNIMGLGVMAGGIKGSLESQFIDGSSAQYSGVSAYYEERKLIGAFKEVLAEDNDCLGRPLCQIRKPKDLGDYMQIRHADINAPLTKSELTAIKSYLESGFFYE